MNAANEVLPPRATDPRRIPMRLLTQAYLVAGGALLIGVLAIGFMQATTGFTALNQIKLVNERADHLDNLQKLLLDMETATRGYLLTFDVNFLRPYYEAIPRVAKLLKTIEQDYAREDEDHAQVAMLVNDAQGVADSLGITLRQAPRVLPNRHAWLDHDKLVMDAYRQQHNKLKDMLLADSQRYTSTSVRNFRYARFATVLLAISGALLLLLAMKLNQKQQMLRDRITRMLHTENDRLEREVRHRTEELASLATYLTNVREEEKLHLARELHDEMGALLTAAKLDANWLERKLGADPQIAERLARLQQTLTTGVTLKRRITNDLRPALLYDLGLIDALRLLAGEFEKAEETALTLNLPEENLQLSDAVSLTLFRIVQEAFTNIRKYAKASRVSLTLRENSTSIELVVEDDGVGFDPQSRKIARHGLAGIKHRVYTLAGKLDIHSAPGAGTTIRIVLPR